MSSKEKFAIVIETLLKKEPLDEIRVSEIVKESGLSRKTFYRHFCDKYDLMNWYFDQFYQESFGSIMVGSSWEEAMIRCLEIYENKQKILRNAYSSKDINGLRNHDINVTKKIYETFLIKMGANILKDDMQFYIEIAARGGTDMVIEWILQDNRPTKEGLARLLKQSLPVEILKYIAE